jgi:hypothetical protein
MIVRPMDRRCPRQCGGWREPCSLLTATRRSSVPATTRDRRQIPTQLSRFFSTRPYHPVNHAGIRSVGKKTPRTAPTTEVGRSTAWRELFGGGFKLVEPAISPIQPQRGNGSGSPTGKLRGIQCPT